jgi:hypothetical protein
MTKTSKKIATSIAWGLAFDSATELIVAMLVGGRGGAQLGRGKDVAEVTESMTKSFDKWNAVVPILAGIIGLSLGLMGRLPGTEN